MLLHHLRLSLWRAREHSAPLCEDALGPASSSSNRCLSSLSRLASSLVSDRLESLVKGKMGVKGLHQVIKQYAPGAVTSYPSVAALPHRRLAIDTNLLLNKLNFSRPPLEPGVLPRHLNHDLYHLCKLLERWGVEPIFAFDGVGRVPQKTKEVQRRVAQSRL